MKELLTYILESLIGKKDFEIEETLENDSFIKLTAHLNNEDMGLVIGKQGSNIKAIRNILRIKAILDRKAFSLNVLEKTA